MEDRLTECRVATEQFARANSEKLPFAGDSLERVNRFITQIRDMTDLFCQRASQYAKQSLSYVSEVLPLCKFACPALFPSTVKLFASSSRELTTSSFLEAELKVMTNMHHAALLGVPAEKAPPATDNNAGPKPDGGAEAAPAPHAHSHRHRHRSPSSSSLSSSSSPLSNPDLEEPEDPVAAQMQAAQDIWNSASDFNSATTLFTQGVQDTGADFARATETYLQQCRFSPISGDAFRKGGLDGVHNAAEWSERNAEIVRGMRESLDDVLQEQLLLTQRLGHLAFEALEVCRACNVAIPTPDHHPVDVGLLKAKALTQQD
eukprot:c17739_g1_i1.p1 GENE.c17739_g1_i1~~c17739_g1_i1.p1  ORF type:complete len:318 (-),score=68.20 c17739_g1_i1:164-1117(-)